MSDDNQDNLEDISSSYERICFCFGVTRGAIEQAVLDNNLKGIEQITRYTSAGGGCKGCQGDIRRIIDETRRQNQLDQKEQARWENSARGSDKMPLIKRIRLTESVFQEQLCPHFAGQGIGIVLVDIKAERVTIRFDGPSGGSLADRGAWAAYVQSVLDEQVPHMIVTVVD